MSRKVIYQILLGIGIILLIIAVSIDRNNYDLKQGLTFGAIFFCLLSSIFSISKK